MAFDILNMYAVDAIMQAVCCKGRKASHPVAR